MSVSFFQIDRSQHTYLTFIAEAHDGLCSISTVDRQQGIVRISAPQGREREVQEFLDAFRQEIGMREVAWSGC